MECYVALLNDAVCPQLITLITQTFIRRVCCLQKVASTQLTRYSEFRPQKVTSTTACPEYGSLIWKPVVSHRCELAWRRSNLLSFEDSTKIRSQGLALSQKTASLRIHYRRGKYSLVIHERLSVQLGAPF